MMKKINRLLSNLLSILLVPLVLLLAILPFRVLYLFSRFIFILLWYAIGYRKNVVLDNLKKAFPEKGEEEWLQIAQAFYRHLSDLIVESLGLMTASASSMRRRIQMDKESKKLMKQYYSKGRSAILLLGHYGNWEWMGAGVNLENPGQLTAAYKHLRNKVFDRIVYNMRMRFYKQLIPSKNLVRKMISICASGESAIFALLADQWPKPDTAFWVSFLGRETPFFTGPEKLARKLKLPVLFCSIRKQKRGHYLMNVQVITEKPQTLEAQEITRRYAFLLEQEIRRAPQYWLWSHKRWKKEKA